MAEVAAPELVIAVNAPVPDVILLLRMTLPVIFKVEGTAELLIAIKLPVPAFVQEIILLLVMLSTPEQFVFTMPDKTEAPVPDAVQF